MELTSVALTVALLVSVPAAAPRPRAAPPQLSAAAAADPWLGEDKFRHFLMSFAGTTFSYAVARSLADHDTAAALALGAGAAAGIGKEVYDRASGRPFSMRDLAWDGLGMLAAWALVRNTR